ncbi:cuticle protein 19-like [Ochlerotatus camptorhynchus]|uniref:cuticle protein 19-like n=1 Tax=Ochlerotatus camptorhynchus TaxID=644619 RepID=UPI0031DD7751
MASKLLILAALIVITSAASRRYDQQRQASSSSRNQQQQQDHRPQHQQDEDQHSDPNYAYSYAVRDDWSGDWKSQHESRHGDQVRGQYRVMESDGTERIVNYSADDRNGFNAVVRYEPERRQHPVPVEAVAVHAIKVYPVVDAPEHRQNREDNKEATSSMHIYQQYSPQPWMISNKVRHN